MGVTETSQDQCASCEHSGPNVELSAEPETLPASKMYGILAWSVCGLVLQEIQVCKPRQAISQAIAITQECCSRKFGVRYVGMHDFWPLDCGNLALITAKKVSQGLCPMPHVQQLSHGTNIGY